MYLYIYIRTTCMMYAMSPLLCGLYIWGKKTSSIPGMHHAQKAPVASRRKAVLGREVLKQRPRSGQGLPGRGQKWGVLQLIALEKGK